MWPSLHRKSAWLTSIPPTFLGSVLAKQLVNHKILEISHFVTHLYWRSCGLLLLLRTYQRKEELLGELCTLQGVDLVVYDWPDRRLEGNPHLQKHLQCNLTVGVFWRLQYASGLTGCRHGTRDSLLSHVLPFWAFS